MSKIFSIFAFILGCVFCFDSAHAAVCFNNEISTKWYCADIQGCTEATDEAGMFSPAQCDPHCADMGLETKIDYNRPDATGEDTEYDESCAQVCRIRIIRSCTY